MLLPDSGTEFDFGEPEADDLTTAYRDQITSLAAQGAEVVVMPEKLFIVDTTESDAFRATWAEIARTAGATVVVGAGLGEGDRLSNVAAAFPPDGGEPVIYRKQHLVPGLEDVLTAGTTRELVPGTTWGLVVCKDLDFPGLVADYADDGAAILLVPSWDFGVDGRLHSRMAVTRGVEQGLTVVRPARDGLVTVSDPYGNVVETDIGGLAVAADTRGTSTVYGALGDWLPWGSLVAVVFVGVVLTWRRRSSTP